MSNPIKYKSTRYCETATEEERGKIDAINRKIADAHTRALSIEFEIDEIGAELATAPPAEDGEEDITIEKLREEQQLIGELISKLQKELTLIFNDIENRYIAGIAGDYSAILSDINLILEANSKSDFAQWYINAERHFKIVDRNSEDRKIISAIHKDFEACFMMLWREVLEQRRALARYELPFDEAIKLVAHRAHKLCPFVEENPQSTNCTIEVYKDGKATGRALYPWHIPPFVWEDTLSIPISKFAGIKAFDLEAYNDSIVQVQMTLWDDDVKYLALPNNNATNAIASVNPRTLPIDALTGSKRIESLYNTLYELSEDAANGISSTAIRLLHASSAMLAQSNTYKGNADLINPTVNIPLKEWARLNGQNIERQECSTAEEARTQDARIQERIKEFRKIVGRDLRTLQGIRAEWRNDKRGEMSSSYFISSFTVKGGNIRISFDADFARIALNASPLMQYPVILLNLPAKDANSYAIGYRLSLHHSNDNNRNAGTDNRLSVIKLIEFAPEIQSYESMLGSNNRNWKRRIKDRVENSLNALVNIGYLTAWNYASSSSLKITPEEAAQMKWEDYSKLYVDFAVKDELEDTSRLLQKNEAKREAAEQAKKPQRKRGRPRKNT